MSMKISPWRATACCFFGAVAIWSAPNEVRAQRTNPIPRFIHADVAGEIHLQTRLAMFAGLEPAQSLRGLTNGTTVTASVQVNGNGDIGGQINALEAGMPAGGRILIPTLATGQCYEFTIPIVITRQIILEGDGPSTCLNFQGSGAAISFQGGVSTVSSQVPVHSPLDGWGLRDLTLIGSGASGGQTGLSFGGPQNAVGFLGSNLNVDSFGVGLQFNRGVWNFKIDHSMFGQNGKNVDWPASLAFGGENVEFDHTTFVGAVFANSLEFNSGGNGVSNLSSLTFVSCNFDDAQLVINNGSGSIRLFSPHFENPSSLSANLPFVKISAFTAATDVEMNGPDFYNDSNSPYPPDFIELDGSPTVNITQMRSLNLDGSTNIPANIAINGDAQLTLTASSPLRAAQLQYVVNSGNPRIWETANQNGINSVTSGSPFFYNQNVNGAGPDSQAPSVSLGGTGYSPTVGFNLWTGTGASYYGAQIREGAPGELDFCANGASLLGGGTYTCNASISNGVFKSTTPDGTAPLDVASHTPPNNLNAWPATFNAQGQQVVNPHVTADKVILPASGTALVQFQAQAAFTQTPVCSLTYQTPFPIPRAAHLSSNPSPHSIAIQGTPYFGVYFVCIGN